MKTKVVCLLAVLLTVVLSGCGKKIAVDNTTDSVRFCINSHLTNFTDGELRGSATRPKAIDRTLYLDAVRDSGLTTIRETLLSWADIELERGKGYNFDPFDDVARKASKRGIEIVGIAYPFPCWATGATPTSPDQLYTVMWQLPLRKYEADFRRFIYTAVRRYCGRYSDSLKLDMPVKKWIFSNELDAFFPAGYDEYAFWLKVFWQEVKRADPDAQVVTMGMSHPRLHTATGTAYIDDFLDSPELQGPGYPYFDIINFHLYPRDFGADNLYWMNSWVGHIRRALHSRNIKTEIWLGETGDRSVDSNLQASWSMKALIHGASTGVSRVYLQCLWDLTPEHPWGILENTPSGQPPVRKPLFTAVQVLTAKIGDNCGVQFLGPGRYLALTPDGGFVFIVWSEAPNTEFGGLLHGKIRVTTLGNEEKIMDAGELKLTAEPVFVEAVK